jgi:hypothetical protein
MNLATSQLQHYSCLYSLLYKGSSLRALLIVGRGVVLSDHFCKSGNVREIMADMTEGGTALVDRFASHIQM